METQESYVVLAKPTYSKPVWFETYNPSLDADLPIYSPYKRRIFGPYLVGPDGYESAAEGFSNDPAAEGISLDDPATWFETDEGEEVAGLTCMRYLILVQSRSGESYWIVTDNPQFNYDYFIRTATPHHVFGPYFTGGIDGYDYIEEAFYNDPRAAGIDLADPETWFETA